MQRALWKEIAYLGFDRDQWRHVHALCRGCQYSFFAADGMHSAMAVNHEREPVVPTSTSSSWVGVGEMSNVEPAAQINQCEAEAFVAEQEPG